jgi:hypothetical protein
MNRATALSKFAMRFETMKQLSAMLLLASTLCSMSWADTIEDASKISGLKAGATTSAEVQALFGKPVHEDHNPDGRFVYLYECRLAYKGAPAKPPLVGKIAFLFAPDSRYVRFSLYQDTNAAGPVRAPSATPTP